MVEKDPVPVSSQDKFQQEVMKKIVAMLQDTPYVLKGGAALILTRGLERHTTDLDFDSDKAINIEKRIREGLKEVGVEILSLKSVKNTDSVQRFKIHYLDPYTGNDVLFKVETSFRTPPDPKNVEIINGIKTYKASQMFEQKMNALKGRTQARDLYDLAHLLQHYGECLSARQIDHAAEFSADLDSLISRYENSFTLDVALNQRTTIDDTVLSLREAVENHLQQRQDLLNNDIQ